MQLRIQHKLLDNTLLLTLWGQLDAMTADSFAATVKSIVNSSIKYVILDFCNLEVIDSAGIGAMVALLKKTRADGGDTVVAEVTKQPLEVFKILSLNKSIKIFDSSSEAVTYCKEQAVSYPALISK
jgi:anti-sigma B factor antagonist